MRWAATLIALVAIVLPAAAQKSLYLLKDNKVVATSTVAEGDYATFKRPTGLSQQTVGLEALATGKNFIQYQVKAAAGQYYAHGFWMASTVDQMLQNYYGVTLDKADETTLKAVLRVLLQYKSYTDSGSAAYTITNGENDGHGTDFFVPGGQDFYVACNNLTSVDDQGGTAQMGDEFSVVKMTTLEAGTSAETVSVEYTGLTDDDEATFSITPSSGIVTLYTLLAKKKELDQNVSIYGFDKVFFGSAEAWTATDWAQWGAEQSWSLDGEDDYVMTVLAIDGNGDWTKAECERHIATAADNCPKINIVSKEAADGSVEVTYEISPSNVKTAHVRLMKENDLDDALNQGQTLQQLAVEGDADDVTATINGQGQATFSKSDLARAWYALLISATDEQGTTICEADFHSHRSDSQWEINTKTFAADEASAKTHTGSELAAKAHPSAARLPQLSAQSMSGRTLNLLRSLSSTAASVQSQGSTAPALAASDAATAAKDSLFLVQDGILTAIYEVPTEVDCITFTKPETPTPEGNVFVYDGTVKELKSVFYLLNEEEQTADFYLTYVELDDAKLVTDAYQYAHISLPLSSLGSDGGLDITGSADFKFDFVDYPNDEAFHLSRGNVGSATGTIAVSQQSADSFTIDIAVEGLGGSHTFTAHYDGQCMLYDLSVPNAYRLQQQDDIALNSVAVKHSDGFYTIWLSQQTEMNKAEADIVVVVPEEYLNDGIKGFSFDEPEKQTTITYDGVTYNQTNTTKGGDAALAMGGNADLKINDGQLSIDFAVYNIYKYNKANLTGHFEGPVEVEE